jgi:zinc protease
LCAGNGTFVCCAGLFALVLSCSGLAQAGSRFKVGTAASGALVLFVESHDLPMLDVSVELPAGSARDTPGDLRLANLTLRLMRLGADGMDEEEIARRLADIGANLNASFDVDRAGYTLRTLSSDAEQREALAVMSRVLQAPSFPAAVLEREKGRVIAGLKEADSKPDVIASRTFARLLFRDHPYALRANGEPGTVAMLTRDNVLDFYRTHYPARRAVVAIMGDVTRNRATEIAEQLTRDLPQTSASLPPLPPEKLLEAPVERLIEHPSAQSHVLIGEPGCRAQRSGLLSSAGRQSHSGRRRHDFAAVRAGARAPRLSYSVYSFFIPYQQPGPFQVGLQTRRDQAQDAGLGRAQGAQRFRRRWSYRGRARRREAESDRRIRLAHRQQSENPGLILR